MAPLSLAHIAHMFKLQHEVNTISKPDWVQNPPDYMLAAAVEVLGEGLEHTPWKWWKKGEMHKKRFALELVDAVHFIISQAFVHENLQYPDRDISQVPERYQTCFAVVPVMECDQKVIEGYIRELTIKLLDNYPPIACLTDVCKLFYTIGYTAQDMFAMYLGKNLLNRFRQENGYKQGTYVKVWDIVEGKEDNDFLQEFLASQDINAMEPEALTVLAHQYLTDTYAKVSKA